MKKLFMIGLMVMSAVLGMAQNVSLTFTGQDVNKQFMRLSRVAVENVTQNWQDTMYYPDTVLVMGWVGIEDYEAAGYFVMQQNNPNPFAGVTNAMLRTSVAGDVVLELKDLNGRMVDMLRITTSMQAAVHKFRINVAVPGTYLLTAHQNGMTSSIKMVNTAKGTMNKIDFVETQSVASLPVKNFKKTKMGQFTPGDEMAFTGYTVLKGTEYVSQTIRQNQFESEKFVFDFNVAVPAGLATVTTADVTGVTHFTANCGGDVMYDGGHKVQSRGVCWSTKPNPEFDDNHVEAGDGLGRFSCKLTELKDGVTYYVRAYAVNSEGIAYGEQKIFTALAIYPCGSTFTDYDGNTYKTVKIGEQCWMKENLKVTHYSNGDEIPVGDSESKDIAYRYYPGDNAENVEAYGLLYNWAAVMGSSWSSDSNPSGVQGVCPDGWHVPSMSEWAQLTKYVSGQDEYVCGNEKDAIAKALASTTGWPECEFTCSVGYKQEKNNATGFTAVPAGNYPGSAFTFGKFAYFWSATRWANPLQAYGLTISNISEFANITDRTNTYGFSVRCISD